MYTCSTFILLNKEYNITGIPKIKQVQAKRKKSTDFLLVTDVMEMMWVVWKLEMMRKVEECSVLLRWSWVQFSVSTDEWEGWESP